MRRFAQGDRKRFPALARELVDEKVNVFFAPTKVEADAAWYASRSTPTVIANINDPVAPGYVKSLGRPGTPVTGVLTSNADLTGKRLALLAEMVPGLKRVGVLIDEAIRVARVRMAGARPATAHPMESIVLASDADLPRALNRLQANIVRSNFPSDEP